MIGSIKEYIMSNTLLKSAGLLLASANGVAADGAQYLAKRLESCYGSLEAMNSKECRIGQATVVATTLIAAGTMLTAFFLCGTRARSQSRNAPSTEATDRPKLE